jgi:hypothetical protein
MKHKYKKGDIVILSKDEGTIKRIFLPDIAIGSLFIINRLTENGGYPYFGYIITEDGTKKSTEEYYVCEAQIDKLATLDWKEVFKDV